MKTDNVNITSDFWVGIVEDNSSDPLKLGQCKVRIIGTHSWDGTELPTSALPWAIPAMPVNTSKTVSVPNINDWVFGYFLDGQNKQMPVIMGVLPGLVNYATYVKLTGEQKRDYLQKLASQPVPPATMNTNDGKVPGETPPQKDEPTTSRVSRGDIANTSISITNNNIGHTCHVASEAIILMNKAKVEVASIIQPIRSAIVSAFASGGSLSPALTGIKEFAGWIAAQLRMINGILKQIIEPIQKITRSIVEIRAVIEYIMSLPEKIVRYLQNCLDQLYAALTKGAFEIIGEVTNLGTISNDNLIATANEISSIISESQQALQNVATIYAGPATIANALLSPSNLSESEKEELTAKVFPELVTFNKDNFKTL